MLLWLSVLCARLGRGLWVCRPRGSIWSGCRWHFSLMATTRVSPCRRTPVSGHLVCDVLLSLICRSHLARCTPYFSWRGTSSTDLADVWGQGKGRFVGTRYAPSSSGGRVWTIVVITEGSLKVVSRRSRGGRLVRAGATQGAAVRKSTKVTQSSAPCRCTRGRCTRSSVHAEIDRCWGRNGSRRREHGGDDVEVEVEVEDQICSR